MLCSPFGVVVVVVRDGVVVRSDRVLPYHHGHCVREGDLVGTKSVNLKEGAN